MINWTNARDIVAFWLLGLCNNYGYVIMLSAAEDILSNQKGTDVSNSTSTCEKSFSERPCESISTGAVLLADNLPGLLVQTTFPFFMHRFPFGFRAFIVFLLQAASYFVVAYSNSIAMSLAGVCMASLGQGIGEITFLAMAAHYIPETIASWSSGTGGAGLIGSFSYAFITEAGLSPSNTLLVQLFIPVVFAAAYFLILTVPSTVYSPTFNPKTWIIPKNYDWDMFEAAEARGESLNTKKVPQRELGIVDRLKLIVPLLYLMVPLATVYTAEYMINQGLTELIVFNCSQGLSLSLSSQYRWYQVLYQLGVFISRSSVKFFEMPLWLIWCLPVLQCVNMIFFFFEAVYWFTPTIIIIFVLIVFEGLLGGSAYVNTYNKIHKKVEPDVREFSLSAASMGNSLGTNIAAFLSIPLYNWVCSMKTPHQ
uniref:Battenin n=1 Tax=Caenorhabditis japonica TaxID=281687 RepID=A0A8R1HQN7_CAEJA